MDEFEAAYDFKMLSEYTVLEPLFVFVRLDDPEEVLVKEFVAQEAAHDWWGNSRHVRRNGCSRALYGSLLHT